MIATTYGFDPAGRLNAIGFGDHAFSYGYVPNSNLIQTVTSRTAGNEILTATKTWDNLNRLYRIQSTSTATVGGLSQTFTYGYNRANQRTGVTREDGTRWDYGYDALGQVTGAVNREADGDPLLGREFGYAYDHIGNRTSATFGNNHTIGYTTATGDGTQYASITTPGVSVVTGEVDPTATVAINGTPAANRQSGYFSHEVTLDNSAAPAAATVNVAATLGGTTETQQREAFVPKAVVTPEYDFDGNLTFDGFLEYTWDAENRLVGVRTRPGLAPAGSTSRDFRQEMTYDHASRRIRCTTFVKINGTERLASDDAYVYDGWNQIAVLNALTRQPRQTYAWGLDLSGSLQGAGGVCGLLAVRDVPSGDTHFVNRDVNGNVMGLVDAGSGALTASYEYDAFGNLLAMEGFFAARNPWRFSTKTVDRFTGHYYYGYRFYDPVAGRWLGRDPIEETGGYNLYGFVANATLVTVDPLGLRSIAPPGGVPVSSTFSTTSGGVNPSAFSTGGGGFSSTFTSAGGGTLRVSPVAGSASVGAGSSAVFGTPLVPIALVGVAVYAWTPHGQGLIDDLITEPWVDFLSYKSPSLDWSDDLPMPEDLLDIPDLDLRRPPKPCKRKCRFDWPPAPQRIDDASIWQRRTAGPRELKVTTPEGLWEQFDGGVDSGSTDPKIAIEAKSGYGFLLRPQLQWTDNQHATYLRVLAQLMRQWYVAHRCGLKWEIHVDNPDGKAGIAGRYPFAAPYITKP